MPPEQKADIDGDFLTAIAEQPNEILKYAMYLFLGYLDGEIQYVSFASRNLANVGRRPVRGRRSRKFAYRWHDEVPQDAHPRERYTQHGWQMMNRN